MDFIPSKTKPEQEYEQAPTGEIMKTLRGHLRDRLRQSRYSYKDGQIHESEPAAREAN